MKYRLFVLFLLSALLFACTSKDDKSLIDTSRRVFGPLPAGKADAPELVRLGRELYFSNDLSVTKTQSCASCHPIDGSKPGTDGQRTSDGARGTRGRRNAPTVLNADLHFVQFWDGRAKTLEEQAAGPITNPAEMAMPDVAAVEERLRSLSPSTRAIFTAAFPNEPDPFTIGNAARAIAAFERTLRTHDRFDEFQAGNARALTAQEKEGLRRFMALGCTSCHNGPLLGARIYQRIGIVNAYESSDRGRFELTKDPSDDHVFKVPSLRNVALTKPYFHDGSIPNLNAAVDKMAWHQLGIIIQPKDREAIVAFLQSMSDVKKSM
jgi:cytochrome c peroxidase